VGGSQEPLLDGRLPVGLFGVARRHSSLDGISERATLTQWHTGDIHTSCHSCHRHRTTHSLVWEPGLSLLQHTPAVRSGTAAKLS
jgi:hypothetical protein